MRKRVFALFLSLICAGFASAEVRHVFTVFQDAKHDLSAPLRQIPPAPRTAGVKIVVPNLLLPGKLGRQVTSSFATAKGPSAPSTLQPGISFEGIGEGIGFAPIASPPDTNGDVGPNHYVQIVNFDFAVFSKTGALLYGPVSTNTLWTGFGGPCEQFNHGDPIVQYDQLADRWLVSQFTLQANNFNECVAISQTGDPTGAYYRYVFPFVPINDYPHFAIWPDGYYATYHLFDGQDLHYVGGEACAYDREQMLSGGPGSGQCFNMGTDVGGQLASDLDSTNLPPANEPNFIVQFNNVPSPMRLELWKFHVDWLTPANTTLTGPSFVNVSDFNVACVSSCVPQPATTQKLDTLEDRLMYRLAYRNFGDHESLVVNHTVDVSGVTGVRWYEIRDPNGTPTLFQEGTHAPDALNRWMGSVAMDQFNNIAAGYSVANSSEFPGIRFTGRLSTEAPGTLQTETNLITGTGSQTSPRRWGDYSSLTVDPLDDCTFWYTDEYMALTGDSQWSTRIGSFRFPGCALYFDDFEDQEAADWTRGTDPSWKVFQGALTATAKKSTNVSPFGGCTKCSVEARLRTDSAGVRASLYAWFRSSGNSLELVMMEDKNQWMLKQRSAGKTVGKRTIPMQINPGDEHRVRIYYDGNNFLFFLDNASAPLITMHAGAVPSGTVGFRIKSTTGIPATASFGQVAVYR